MAVKERRRQQSYSMAEQRVLGKHLVQRMATGPRLGCNQQIGRQRWDQSGLETSRTVCIDMEKG
jgi:hypothetical protein